MRRGGILLGALLLSTFAIRASADIPQMMSEYSPLDACKVIAQPASTNEPNDAYEARCPAHDGYSVTILGGDVRTWLVLKKGKNTVNLQGVGESDVHFPMIAGKKLEWRYQVTGSHKDLMALIFRVSGQDPQALSDKTKTYLYVIRPLTNGFCILGKAQTNEAARHIADTAKTCP